MSTSRRQKRTIKEQTFRLHTNNAQTAKSTWSRNHVTRPRGVHWGTAQQTVPNILVNPSLSSSASIENSCKDRDGRIVSINLISKTANISLSNVYAPNDSQQQHTFLHNLNEYLIMSNTDTSNLIIGGDCNVTLQSLDKRGGVPWKLKHLPIETNLFQ